jgi:hypothetical protein
MLWSETPVADGKDSKELYSLEDFPIYRKALHGIVIFENNKNIRIDISGTFSIKKRKIIALAEKRSVYRIIIQDISSNIKYIAVDDKIDTATLYPAIKTSGMLFQKNSKKIAVDRKGKIEFNIDMNGRIVF